MNIGFLLHPVLKCINQTPKYMKTLIMLNKIIKIKNIKQWQHAGGLDGMFNNLNLIYGRNGSGKSTLCKIFEYINNNEQEKIKSLKPIENNDAPQLELLINNSKIDLNRLQTPVYFHIFNQDFIDKNVYISRDTDKSQLVNYYNFSLGMVSVEHEKEISNIKTENDTINTKLTPLILKVSYKFNQKQINEIKKIPKTQNADEKLNELKKQLKDTQAIEHFKKRKKLSTLKLEKPEVNLDIFNVNLDNLARAAVLKVNKHIEDNMKKRDTHWITTGVEQVTEKNNCPFCGQNLSSSPIYHLYQDFMNESYTESLETFELNSNELYLTISNIGVDIENLSNIIEENKKIITEWSDRINTINLHLELNALKENHTSLVLECSSIINQKKSDLLSKVDLTRFNRLLDTLFNSVDFNVYNQLASDFNSKISTFIQTLDTKTSESINKQISDIEESVLRYSADIVNDLSEIKKLESLKKENTKKISKLREKINIEQEKSIGEHKDSINSILKSFNSMIRLSELKKDNKGKKGATRVTYVIKFINNELSIVNDNERIFEHILSLGDRSALALAFFLSRFHKPNMEKSVIILDDPMSSLDSHRKNATIIEIEKLVNNNYQTFILSHDPFFLSDIHKHAILSKSTSCFEIDASYVDADPLAKNSMQYISSKLKSCASYDSYVMHSYTKEYNTLYDFVHNGGEESKVAIARSIRPVLEAYLRFLHPREFTAGVWLGTMLTKIREEKNPDSPLYDKHKKFDAIDKINQFSKQFHHAQEFDTNIQSLDFQTVKSYAKETLLLITGL